MRRFAVILSVLVVSFLNSAASGQEVRVEHDLLGQKEVPASAYYGVQTARALEIVREQHILTGQQINELLDPAKLTGLDASKYSPNK